jgi:hypothetical protein
MGFHKIWKKLNNHYIYANLLIFGLKILGKENLLCLLLEFLQECSHMKCDIIYLNFFSIILNVIYVAYYNDIVKKNTMPWWIIDYLLHDNKFCIFVEHCSTFVNLFNNCMMSWGDIFVNGNIFESYTLQCRIRCGSVYFD